ncbi:hypothetical protein ABIB25_000081 [Nakamurella sp. UYEF19]
MGFQPDGDLRSHVPDATASVNHLVYGA